MSPDSTDTDQILEIYNLSAYIVIIIVGVIWNGTLLFIFARHKEIRTTANTMIFNLAVCDVVNLVVVAPIRYKFHYPHQSPGNVAVCRCIDVFHHWILCASALSVVALSVQRFCIIVLHSKFHNTRFITTVYILFIWLISLIISIPYGIIWSTYEYLCGNYDNPRSEKIMILLDLIYYCVFLPFLMFFFNLATARRLRKSIRNLVGSVNSSTRELVRKRSSNVVTVLSVFFLLTHVPNFSWRFYAYYTDVDRQNTTILTFEYVSKHFLFLNSLFNPVALFVTSSVFRKLFRMYLCCSKVQKKAGSSNHCSFQR